MKTKHLFYFTARKHPCYTEAMQGTCLHNFNDQDMVLHVHDSASPEAVVNNRAQPLTENLIGSVVAAKAAMENSPTPLSDTIKLLDAWITSAVVSNLSPVADSMSDFLKLNLD